MVLTTAVRAAKVVGEIEAGARVLITAGSSATGSMAIQVAKALGAEVAATVRNPAKRGFVEAAGADLVIDTSTDDVVAPGRRRLWDS